MSRFVFTGGHHNSALVVAQKLRTLGHTIYWYGHRYSSRGDKNDSAEYLEVTASQIPFFDLPAGRATASLRELSRIPLGIIYSLKLLRKHKPHAVITFGGYLGAATTLAAALLRIPIYLHEQTVKLGKANLLAARFAKKIYLTWPDSKAYLKRSNLEVVGLPLRPSLLNAKKKDLFTRRKPTLLIMGGKQGAHSLNQFVYKNLRDLLVHFNLIHQTGTNSQTQDYEQALSRQATLGSLQDCYLPLGYITENQIGTYLRSADYYLGRSGAHMCYELLFTACRSVLVPLPGTHRAEQHANALAVERVGLGLIVPQSELTLENVLTAIKTLSTKKAPSLKIPADATERIINDLKSL